MVKRKVSAAAVQPQVTREKDKDYTVPALIAIVAAVLITALFFAQPNVAQRASAIGTVGGNAYVSAPAAADKLAPTSCEPSSICDGTKLIRQQRDCTRFEAFCTNGCDFRAGNAACL